METAISDHISRAARSGSSEMFVTCFASGSASTRVGPRVWNDQLLRFAGYSEPDGSILGDPANALFTQMLEQRFDWRGPAKGRTAFDYLPHVVQIDPSSPPELFDVFSCAAAPVAIWHPQIQCVAGLDLRWYPIPAVSSMELSVGGLLYTACPFNGWYASTEVVRDLCDEERYNILPRLAALLGLDTSKNASLWRDRAQLVMSEAVLHSFAHAKVAMVDHHTMIEGFYEWYLNELSDRGYCPGNWKWVIPPQTSSCSRAYSGLNSMKEYTLKPAWLHARGWAAYAHALDGDTYKKNKRLNVAVRALRVAALALLFLAKLKRGVARRDVVRIALCYASVTGTTRRYAARLAATLGEACVVDLVDLERFESANFERIVSHTTALVVLSATYGDGDVPFFARPFVQHLNVSLALATSSKPFAVLGFGCSNFLNFCGAADEIADALASCGCVAITACGKCDAVHDEEASFEAWTRQLVGGLAAASRNGAATVRFAALEKALRGGDCDASGASRATSSGTTRFSVVSRASAALLADADVTRIALACMGVPARPPRRHSAMMRTRATFGAAEWLWCGRSGTAASSPKYFGAQTLPNFGAPTSSGFVSARIAKVERLLPESPPPTVDEASRQTSLVTIDISACGNQHYRAGDHLMVLPNTMVAQPTLRAFAKAVGARDLEQFFVVSLEAEEPERSGADDEFPRGLELKAMHPLLATALGSAWTVRSLLTQRAEILAPIDAGACGVLAAMLKTKNTAAPRSTAGKRAARDADALDLLSTDAQRHSAAVRTHGLRWLDAFENFRSLLGVLDLATLVSLAPPTHARTYSIASCKETVGGYVELCVGRYVYQLADGAVRKGAASDFLTLAQPNTELLVKVESFRQFYHPSDPKAPILLVGAGTGVAPLRALVQQRAWLKSRGALLGDAHLVFGCRSEADALFRDEFERAVAEGAITHLHTAYSRAPGAPSQYVQDILLEQRAVFEPLLKRPDAHVFVCGSSRIALQVQKAITILTGSKLIAALIGEHRLHLDIFGNPGNERAILAHPRCRQISKVLGALIQRRAVPSKPRPTE